MSGRWVSPHSATRRPRWKMMPAGPPRGGAGPITSLSGGGSKKPPFRWARMSRGQGGSWVAAKAAAAPARGGGADPRVVGRGLEEAAVQVGQDVARPGGFMAGRKGGDGPEA